MGIDSRLADLVGEWKGTNRLHAPWMPQPLQKSNSTATVRSIMKGQFLSIEYTWTFEDKPQEGMLLLGCDPKSDAVQAVWTDSWHSKDVLMLCNGARDEAGKVSVLGPGTSRLGLAHRVNSQRGLVPVCDVQRLARG